MKHFLIPLLCLAMLLCIAGCTGSDSNLETPPATLPSTPAPTTTAPTTQPALPTQTTTPTTQPTLPTTVPTVPAPTVGATCPPIEGDQYWGEFRGKRFSNPTGISEPVTSIRLYSDGTCKYSLSIFSSSWPGSTVWSFDGEYLYIGSVESGYYSTFLYVGADDPNESKLIFVKSDHDRNYFSSLPDGQEFTFGGIMEWESE